VYEGDTVESLVAAFVRQCPIDDFMIEKLKLLLQQQMDNVLERIDENEESKSGGEEHEEEENENSVEELINNEPTPHSDTQPLS